MPTNTFPHKKPCNVGKTASSLPPWIAAAAMSAGARNIRYGTPSMPSGEFACTRAPTPSPMEAR